MFTIFWIIAGLIGCVITFILNPIRAMLNSAIIIAFLVAAYGWIGIVGGSGYQSEGSMLALAILGTIGWVALLVAKMRTA
ncbi:hypothetical protein [Glutamicibacter arilaitensis]|uniref:hypothetical protein n=1 Tax=Glutamicibacter TaxID=1742989 RepID=UPI003F8DD057